MRLSNIFNIFTVLLAIINCQEKPKPGYIDLPEFFEFQNLDRAPEAIQNAAKAVVRIVLPFSAGTGFFINDQGLLLTNQHVISEQNCSQSGCFLYLNFDFQIDQPLKYEVLVFAQPLRANSALDVTLFQIKEVKEPNNTVGENLKTPHYLNLVRKNTTDFNDEKVFYVGHPHAQLKKWNQASVINYRKDWLYLDGFVLPGNSGSPLLNSEGQVIGIVHRTNSDVAHVRKHSLRTEMIATASAPLLDFIQPNGLNLVGEQLLDTALLKNYRPIDTVTAISSSVELELLFSSQINKFKRNKDDKDSRIVQDQLTDICDSALTSEADQYANPPERIKGLISHCYYAVLWFNCKNPFQDKHFKICPIAAQKSQWQARFDQMAKVFGELNFTHPYGLIINSHLALELNLLTAHKVGHDKLEQYLATYQPKLDFELVKYKSFYAQTRAELTYDNKDLIEYALNYKDAPHYDRQIPALVSAIYYLWRLQKIINDGQVKQLFADIFNDPNITLEDKLEIERFAYEEQIL